MTALRNGPETLPSPSGGTGGFAGYIDGIRVVVGMELRQRLRSRGWYVMLAIWFVLVGLVTALTWSAWHVQASYADNNAAPGPGSMIYEIVLAFVLLLALLVAPAFSANAINGDRAAGTLAILQVTLLRPGQILCGKFLASWIAGLAFLVASVPFLIFGIIQGDLGIVQIVVSVLMLAVEIGVVCAIGVGISALASRPLFSIVVTYLSVAGLVVGTLIGFGLGSTISQGTIMVNQVYYKNAGEQYGPDGSLLPSNLGQLGSVTDQNAQYACYGPLVEQPTLRSDRVAWLLGINPFVVVADAIPYPERNATSSYSGGALESISQMARAAQAGPAATTQCSNGKIGPDYFEAKTPLWPLGLGIQLLLAAGIWWLGWRALRTPARRLARGTRVA